MKKIALVGAGWRAAMWAEVVSRLPECSLACILVRDPQKRAQFARFGAPIAEDMEQLLAYSVDAALVCVSKIGALSVSRVLRERGIRVLCETPAGTSPELCAAFAQTDISIAEQYPLQPTFAAVRSIVRRGYLGEVHTLRLSCCHDYHAVALMRALLGTGSAFPRIEAFTFSDRYVVHADRGGERAPQVQENDRTVAILSFGEKRAFYDRSYGQYFSAVRPSHFLLQGTQGELGDGGGVCFLQGKPVPLDLSRVYDGHGGSLRAPDLGAIFCMGECVYENPFRGLRLSEEEIAMAQCLVSFLGEEGYPAREAALDAEIACALHACASKR